MGPGAMSRGVSSDGCDAANKLLENIQGIVGWSASEAESKAAVKAFQTAVNGPASSASYYDKLRLPKVELSQGEASSGARNVINLDSRSGLQAGAGADVTNVAARAQQVGNAALGKVGASAIAEAGPHASADMGAGMGQPDIQGLLHTATTMADPIGFLKAIFELLKILCPASLGAELLQGSGQLIGGLPPMEIYNIGYEASLDMAKRMAS